MKPESNVARCILYLQCEHSKYLMYWCLYDAIQIKQTRLTLTFHIKTHSFWLTSSGQIFNLKLSRSSGSGKSTWQVFGKFNSLISESKQSQHTSKQTYTAVLALCVRKWIFSGVNAFPLHLKDTNSYKIHNMDKRWRF